MKSIFTSLIICTIIVLSFTHSSAAIRRVGFLNSSTLVSGLDYADFQTAHDAANNGDTIQLYPSTNGGSSFSGTIIKQLVILGSGYYYNSYNLPASGIANTGLQILPGGGPSCSFTIGLGSAGTIFQGVDGLSLTTSSIPDSLNNITILRCRGASVSFTNSGVCNNWVISQCINANVSQGGYTSSFSGNRTITNLRIENCLGVGVIYSAGGTGQSPVGINSGQILNCIFFYTYYVPTTGTDYLGNNTLTLNNSVFVVQNCIDITGVLNNPSGCANSIFINNLTATSAANNLVSTNPGCSGNVFGVTYDNNSIFVGYPTNTSGSTTLNTPDGVFTLASTSIAKNAGIIPGTTTATDCGIYGGTNPYKASGIPAVPSFYKLTSTSSQATTSPYTITFSAKSNN